MQEEKRLLNWNIIREKRMSKKEKTNKGIPIYRIIILIAVILIIVLIGYMVNKNKGQEGTSKNNQQQTSEQGEQVSEVSLIDMNNTENAKVEEGIKENTSKKLLEEKEYKGLKIKNIELKAEGGISKLTATIENKSGEDYNGEKVNIVFENKDGTEYARLEAVLPAVDNQKTNEIDAGTTADIANTYDFKIETAE